MRILIVEDDPPLGDGLARGLKALGIAADWFTNGKDADQAMGMVRYDAVVLDLGLPGEDGMRLLRRWRGQGNAIPIVILTARDAVESRVAGLNDGADDYLIKPITLDELVARLRAVTRRQIGLPEPVWRHGSLAFEPATRQAAWKGEPVELTGRESSLLELFLMNPNRVLTREFIREKLYDWSEDLESNALEVHVHHLRRKIHPGIVRTLRGAGYALGPEDADA
ncbi:response regulator [Pigmentiphaga sp. CHJ604]|uniref:response regulator n=1 Tax=Pigmentiphaga sp. CHJ604 TaxID=3081984 RepID=UPI0030CE0597